MKKTFTISFLTVLLACTATTVNARSWRINSDATQHADFADLNAAMSSSEVVAGDVLYLDPSCTLTSAQIVTKSVTIVGVGYYRGSSPHPISCINNTLTLRTDGIKLEGVTINSNINIAANNITIERCKISGTINVGSAENGGGISAQYAKLRQCFIINGRIDGRGETSNYSSFFTMENCIFIRTDNSNVSALENFYIPTIVNNYICLKEGNSAYTHFKDIRQGTIQNNILIKKNGDVNIFYDVAECIVERNIMSCGSDSYPSYADDNKFGFTAESGIFAMEGTFDQLYQLKSDSPAKGYGKDGIDCGPFGGPNPYVLNGLPAGYPYYTKATVDSRAKDGKVNVSLKIKMQDE